jgi:hypothetical protein
MEALVVPELLLRFDLDVHDVLHHTSYAYAHTAERVPA